MIEGRHASLDAVLEDTRSTTQDLLEFAGNAGDAVERCNQDKASALRVLRGETE